MTVQELIYRLERFPPYLDVFIRKGSVLNPRIQVDRCAPSYGGLYTNAPRIELMGRR